MKIIAVYPGRFQPFHKGHAQVYKWLKSKFDTVIIATSDKVEAPKSPFNFKEKKKMMTLAGVPSKDVQQVVNPYIAREILNNYDPKTTVLVFAVSQKDMEEDPRFSFKPTKSGKPGYLQPYAGNEKKLKPFGDIQTPKGYVIVAPTFTFDVLGKPATSASELRKQFVKLNHDKQKEFIKDLFGKYDASVHRLMDEKIGAMLGKPKSVKQLKEEVTRKQLAPMLDSFVSFASDKLGLKSMPNIRYKTDSDNYNSFAAYNPTSNELSISTMNRHPMDIFRSVAHELVHHKQNEDGKLGKDIEKEGATGSDIENEANSEAGKIMRWFAKANPDMFAQSYVVEEIANSVSSGGIRGLGNVTGNPSIDDDQVSDYITTNQNDTEIIQNRLNNLIGKSTTDTVYDWNDDTWWMHHLDTKKYHAKTLKSIRSQKILKEGINDPGKLKAVFLAGGPGSGKDFVMNKALAGNGLREINSDTALEFLMKKHGLDLEMPDEERVEREIVRGRAKGITSKKELNSLAGRLGLIVNGTADDLEKIRTVKAELEDLGYDTMMVFVNTSNEVSRQRNVERGKMGLRKVPDSTDKQGVPDNSPNIRQEKWDLAQKNLPELEKIFGKDKFAVIDNTADLRKVTPEEKNRIEGEFSRIRRMTMQFVQSPVQNKRGKAWTERRARYQGTTQYQSPKAYTKQPTPTRIETPKAIVKPSSEVMNQARRLGLSYYGFGRFGRKIGGENKVLYHSKGNQLIKVQTMNEDVNKIVNRLILENSLKDFLPPFTANGLWVSDRRGNNVLEVTRHGKVAQEVADALNKHMNKKINEEKKMKNPCWKGYRAYGMKKKNGKEVPNCVPVNETMDEKFEKSMIDPANREIGTDSLAKNYKKMTPGQEVKEDNVIPRGKFGLPKGGGLGPEYAIQSSPALVTGFANIGNSVYEASQSIKEWAMNPKTQQKFAEKYGNLAEEKLIEAALRLEAAGCGCDHSKPKSVKKLKEAWSYGKDPADTSSPIGNQNRDTVSELSLKGYKKKIDFRSTQEKKHASLMDEKEPINPIKASIAEAIDKAKMKCNAPRAQSHGSGETGKSHVVKACAGGKEKIIRFGQKGVKGSPKKAGESEAYANRRKRFKARHSKNIKKGKMSAAYWANKVKW